MMAKLYSYLLPSVIICESTFFDCSFMSCGMETLFRVMQPSKTLKETRLSAEVLSSARHVAEPCRTVLFMGSWQKWACGSFI